jgi:hypothetical protein
MQGAEQRPWWIRAGWLSVALLSVAVMLAWLTAAAEEAPPPTAPDSAPKLADHQKIGIWEWDKFHWVDPEESPRRVQFRITIPAGHKFCTVVIDDAQGRRVRNLLDMVECEKLGGDPASGQPQTMSLEWNGLDDYGYAAPPGDYRVRGCSHAGLQATYEYSFLNPGSPPWELYKNSGWGGDHGFPHAIACLRGHGDGPWRVAIGGTIAEGGSPAFILGAEDKKIHAFGRGWAGPRAMAAKDGLLWVGLWSGKDLQRIAWHKGGNVPFQTPQGAKPVLTFEEDVWGIAVGDKKAAVLIRKENDPSWTDRVIVFDKNSGENRVELKLPAPGERNGLTASSDGKMFYASSSEAGCLYRIEAEAEAPSLEEWKLADVARPGALASDDAGHLYVMDRGDDYQVKVVDRDGRLRRAIGAKGGQASRLPFDPAALRGVEAISVDDDGRLWAVENGDTDRREGTGFVRRVAVWSAEGEFVKDFVGTTWYGANTTCLHEQDPHIGYGYGVIYSVDPQRPGQWRPERYVSSGKKEGAPFALWTASPGVLFNAVRLFRSDASGHMREYLLQSSGFPILFQADEQGDYRPILAIGHHGHNPAFPKVEGVQNAVHIWTDLNGDELCQDDEFQFIPAENPSVSFWQGWGYPPPRDMAWYIGGWELKPTHFTERGVPVYDLKSARRLAAGPHHYTRVGEHLLALTSGKFNSRESGVYWAGRYLFTDLAGNKQATYRTNWPAVHPSWSSQLYQPGQVGRSIGEAFWAGVVDTGGDIGHVICAQGNKGQSFFFSEDGLFVSTLFRDSRQSPKGWGSKEEIGADWSDITLMDEAFGGWFGRHDDGQVRYMFGRNGCQVVQVHGLDKVERFDAGTITVKDSAATEERPLRPGKPPDQFDWVIPSAKGRSPAIRVDGKTDDWRDIPRREIQVGDETVASVALALDDRHLCLLVEVIDASPLKNEAVEGSHPFKTGDAIDVQIGPLHPSDRAAPIEGDYRVILSPQAEGKWQGTVYRPVKGDAKPEEAVEFESPVRKVKFTSVQKLEESEVVFQRTENGYLCEARLHCDRIGLQHAVSGYRVRGDIGVLFSNEGGLATESRAYLFDRSPGASIVSDLPSEAEIRPAYWGRWRFE